MSVVILFNANVPQLRRNSVMNRGWVSRCCFVDAFMCPTNVPVQIDMILTYGQNTQGMGAGRVGAWQLYLDDSRMKNFTSCFKEKKFLEFFFKRIRLNKTGRYQDEFPYISLCGRERNYIRCDDVPIVYTHIISKGKPEVDFLTFGYAGELLLTQFQPEKVYMLPETGRVYHPAEEKYGGVGLVRSKLAIEISKNFTFENGESHPPTNFNWKMKNFQLDQSWFSDMILKHNIKIKSDS